MHKGKLLVYTLFCLFVISCGENTSTVSPEKTEAALAYNDKVIDYTYVTSDVNALLKKMKPLLQAALDGEVNPEAVEQMKLSRLEIGSKIDRYLTELEDIKEFDNEVKLKESVVNFLTSLKEILDQDFGRLEDLIQSEMTDKTTVEFGHIGLNTMEKLVNIEEKSRDLQARFAARFNFELNKSGQDYDRIRENIEKQRKQLDGE
jgi:vacuolar-type H+-ATPase subunit I/STV1